MHVERGGERERLGEALPHWESSMQCGVDRKGGVGGAAPTAKGRTDEWVDHEEC